LKYFIVLFSTVFIISFALNSKKSNKENLKNEDVNSNLLSEVSENLLSNIKFNLPIDSLINELEEYDGKSLIDGLSDDNAKKTFWVNIYNSFYQIYSDSNFSKKEIFDTKFIQFKDFSLSLDDIEHGILRKNRNKYSLGYFPKLFARNIVKSLSLEELDYRIHFVLNCGAKSCPPITIINYKNIETQLNEASYNFLDGETTIDFDKKIVYTTKLMLWFKADFEGNKGIKNILSKYLKKDFSDYKIKYTPYNWSEDLGNFSLSK
jgi:hypothetical protein